METGASRKYNIILQLILLDKTFEVLVYSEAKQTHVVVVIKN